MCEDIYVDGLSTSQELEKIDLRYLEINQEKGRFTFSNQMDAGQILHAMITLQVDEMRTLAIQDQHLVLGVFKFNLSILFETNNKAIKKSEWCTFFQVHTVEMAEEEVIFTPYPLDLRLCLDQKGTWVDYFLVYGLEKTYLTNQGYRLITHEEQSLEEELI